ncbi:MAG TPA: pentapeptide repeat-containing protein [Verrucomicrobiae bacterium]|nr:pentapeptide repeat-containing protein [Verrucomicrobiae bacterium]
MKIEIKNRWTESIIFSVTADSMKLAVKLALEQKTDLRGADLRGADLSDAVLPFIPKIEDLDGKILAAIGKEGCALDMESWHVCETTHCRAGWAIHLSGDVGKTLESIYGPSAAGALIYATCYPKLKIPDFTASNEDALADMKQRAKLAK